MKTWPSIRRSFQRRFFIGPVSAALALATTMGWARMVSSPSPSAIATGLRPFVESHSLAGAVMLVATKDQVLNLEAVGYADVAARKPMKTDALFWIASQSKPMTAAALMMLVDDGKVNLDDPVAIRSRIATTDTRCPPAVCFPRRETLRGFAK